MRPIDDRGYAMAALLVAMSVMAVFLSVAMPSWYTMAKREREAELIFRGQQYARSVTLFQRKFAGAYPPNLDMLVTQKVPSQEVQGSDDERRLPARAGRRSCRPSGAGIRDAGGASGTGAGAGARWSAARGAAAQPQQGAGVPGAGIQGVVSKSTEESLRLFNGRPALQRMGYSLCGGDDRGRRTPGRSEPARPAPAPGVPGGPGRGARGQGPGGRVLTNGRGAQPGGFPLAAAQDSTGGHAIWRREPAAGSPGFLAAERRLL
jgi:type II secretory pathway pseudopilin PulG